LKLRKWITSCVREGIFDWRSQSPTSAVSKNVCGTQHGVASVINHWKLVIIVPRSSGEAW